MKVYMLGLLDPRDGNDAGGLFLPRLVVVGNCLESNGRAE